MKDAPLMHDVICVDIWWYWNWILVILKYSEIWSGLGKCHGCQDPDSLDGIRIFMRETELDQLCAALLRGAVTIHDIFHSFHISTSFRKDFPRKIKIQDNIFVLQSFKLKVFVFTEPLSLLPSQIWLRNKSKVSDFLRIFGQKQKPL